MPRLFTELGQGQAFSRTNDEGMMNDTFARVFRIVLSSPQEVFSPQAVCGVYIGSLHPFNANLICHTFDVKYDGDSRMVVLVTFQYKTYASSAASAGREDPKSQPPTIRQAEWSTDTSLVEVPADTWLALELAQNGTTVAPIANAKFSAPINPVGDRYEGLTKKVPTTVIRIEQFESVDPLRWTEYGGHINKKKMKVGDHEFPVHTVLFNGVSYRPHVETFQETTIRGWMASYEFHFRANRVTISDFTGENNPDLTIDVGWDRLQILEGPRVKSLANALGDPSVDQYALPLKHALNGQIAMPLALIPEAIGKPTEAMVAVPAFDPETGGTAGLRQVRASSPVALNSDGTPRNLWSGVLKPIIRRYQVQPDVDFVELFGLRV